jgi:hypothetical protein
MAVLPMAVAEANITCTATQLAKRVMERQGVPFLNIYHALSFRPGGHRPGFGGKGHDCMHFCLPGPLDEMAKLLQMFWSI